MSPLGELGAAFLIVVALAALGAIALLGLRDRVSTAEILGLSFPLGAGVVSWSLFLVSVAGVPLVPVTCVLTYALLGVALAVLARSRAVRQAASPPEAPDTSASGRRILDRVLLVAVWTLVGLVILSLLVLAVGRSYSNYDAAALWAVKGYAISHFGDVAAAGERGAHGTAYPLNLPLQISVFHMFTGDHLPGSKILFPVYALSLAITCATFWQRRGVAGWCAAAGALFLLTVPVMYYHGSIGYADLPFTAVLIAGITSLLEGWWLGDDGLALQGGLFLGLAAWTRPEGVVYAIAVLIVLAAVFAVRDRRVTVRVPAILPLLLVLLTWLPFAGGGIGRSNFGTAATEAVRHLVAGQFMASRLSTSLAIFLRRAVDPTNWGLLVPVAVGLLFVGLRRWMRSFSSYLTALLAVTAVVVFVPFVLFYVESFLFSSAFYEALLIRSFDRAFFPGATMILIFLLSAMEEAFGSGQRASDGSAFERSAASGSMEGARSGA
jgi:hypothetical protein